VAKEQAPDKREQEEFHCGIVMPISPIDGLSAEHWAEVKSIIVDAVTTGVDTPRFSASLVSDADDVGVIQKRIVQGVYGADMVVCDVSGKNPNVMFELGMRLAFDKPTVIIKDDKTDYMFDTGVIEHLTYPRDLRFHRIVDFKQLLASKVKATFEASRRDPEHSTFLKNFGTFKVAQLTEKEASAEQVILESISELQKEVRTWRNYAVNVEPSRRIDLLRSRRLSLSDIESILQRADELLLLGGERAFDELYELQPALRRIIETPSWPAVLRSKASQIYQNLPPRYRKISLDEDLPSGDSSQAAAD